MNSLIYSYLFRLADHGRHEERVRHRRAAGTHGRRVTQHALPYAHAHSGEGRIRRGELGAREREMKR